MSSPVLGTRSEVTLVNETVWACGCRALTNVTPNTLIIWCGLPNCLRLFAANVAYTQQQYNWQIAHGGTPTLVAALTRTMVTPLPQILPPPPPGTQYFSSPPPEQHATAAATKGGPGAPSPGKPQGASGRT